MSVAGDYTWEHSDPKGILPQSEIALVRCAAPVGEGWPVKGSPDMPKGVAELRAWLFRLMAACWSLTKEPLPPDPSKVVFPDFSTARWKSAYHQSVAAHLLTVPLLLAELKYDAQKAPITHPNDPVHMFRTSGADITEAVIEETGNPFLAGLAIVVGAAAWTIGVTVVAQKASEVIDRQLAREEDTVRMAQSASSIIRIVEAHAEAELKKGGAIPFNGVEQAAIQALRDAEVTIAQKQDAPLPSPLPSAKDIGTSVKIGATGLAIAAIVAAYVVAS